MRVYSLVVIAAGLIHPTATQVPRVCERYDEQSGVGVCNGVRINLSTILCGDGFSKDLCKASRKLQFGEAETFYFKGTPSGLPIGSQIDAACVNGDFPSNGGVAVAQVISQVGSSVLCYPAADVKDTIVSFEGPGDTLAVVNVAFHSHTDGAGIERSALIRIQCNPGKAPPYTYTTTGDDHHSQYYEINVEADCTGGSEPQPTTGFRCWNNACIESISGSPRSECEAVCQEPIPVTYVCKGGNCEVGANGGTLADCKKVCRMEGVNISVE
eukprot:m.98510 g.98510  ORF g.98510 m.98510 type:complete len:270 (-) comp16747_c0_seq1:257-1066(-)